MRDSTTTQEKDKATPGPWEACDGASVVLGESEVVVPNHVLRRFTLPDGVRVTQFIADCNTALPESAANARLIAAAPDLLEALIHMRWCRSCAEGSWSECEGGRQAENAIAKAEGKAAPHA